VTTLPLPDHIELHRDRMWRRHFREAMFFLMIAGLGFGLKVFARVREATNLVARRFIWPGRAASNAMSSQLHHRRFCQRIGH
jgi:hypothetical protein